MLGALLLQVAVSVSTHMARKTLIALNADSDIDKIGSASPATVSTTQSRRLMSKKRRKIGPPLASAPLLDETFFLEENISASVVSRRAEESLQDDSVNPSAATLDRMEATRDMEAAVTMTDRLEDANNDIEKDGRGKEKEGEGERREGGKGDGGGGRERDLTTSTSAGWQQIEKLSVDRTASSLSPKGLPHLPFPPHNVTRCVLVEEEERVMGSLIRFMLYTGLMVRCTESIQQI